MNKIMKSFFCILLLCTGAAINARDNCDECPGNSNGGIRSIFIPRSAGANVARELVGWQDFIHQCEMDCFYGVADVQFEYTRSFKPEHIAEQFFGSSKLVFQGSQVENRKENALIADYFGLSTDFDGTLCVRPRIDNFIVDFNFYFGLDQWLCGLYFEAHLPITHTRWTLFDCDRNGRSNSGDCGSNSCGALPTTGNINNCNTGCNFVNSNRSTTPFPATYMSNSTDTVAVTPDLLVALSGNYKFGDMQESWVGGRFSTCRLNRTRLADIDFIFGWDFLKSECYHVGAFLQVIAPTGGRPCDGNIFAPVVGNAGHAEVGGGSSGHIDIWSSCEDRCISFWYEFNITHMFNKCQTRTFDFNNGPMSRYMLLKEIDTDGNYAGRLISGVNFTTRQIETNVRVKGDAAFKLAYRHCGFVFDIGYNVYGHSEERVKGRKNRNNCNDNNSCTTTDSNAFGFGNCCDNLSACSGNIANRTFAIKGCQGVGAQVFETQNNQTEVGTFDNNFTPNPIAINASASDATAFTCGTIDNEQFLQTVPPGIIPPEDRALSWKTFINGVPAANTSLTSPTIVQQPRSNPATLVSLADLNVCSGLAKAQVTHKVFGYVGYEWLCCDYTPFVGILWEVEFDSNNNRRNNDKDCCDNGTTTNNNGCGVNNCFNISASAAATSTATANTVNCNNNDRCNRAGMSQWGIGIKGGLTF